MHLGVSSSDRKGSTVEDFLNRFDSRLTKRRIPEINLMYLAPFPLVRLVSHLLRRFEKSPD